MGSRKEFSILFVIRYVINVSNCASNTREMVLENMAEWMWLNIKFCETLQTLFLLIKQEHTAHLRMKERVYGVVRTAHSLDRTIQLMKNDQ